MGLRRGKNPILNMYPGYNTRQKYKSQNLKGSFAQKLTDAEHTSK